jgi:cell wall-associated NlpC family hydrolase
MLTESDRVNIITEAKSWLGTPFHHFGKLKGVGVDCAMFLRGVYSNCKIIPAFEIGNYPEQWYLHRDEERFLGFMHKYGKEIKSPPLPGDVAIFRFGRCFSHGTIVINWPWIIHAYKPLKKVVYDNVLESGLTRRSKKFFEVNK